MDHRTSVAHIAQGKIPLIMHQCNIVILVMSNHAEVPLALQGHVSQSEWALRCDLAACYRMVALLQWDDLIFTHFSLRLPGEKKEFLINPFGVPFEDITASKLIRIDLEGRPLHPTPFPVNPAGFVLHASIHEAREDAHCIMHLHTPHGVAVSSQQGGLLPISQSAASVYRLTAYHDYEGVVLDANEKKRLVPNLGKKQCLILRNHGLLTVGKTIAEAFTWMYFLQRACEVQVLAQSGGGPLITLSDEVVMRVHNQTMQVCDMISSLSWRAVISRVSRQAPDYRS